MNTKILLVLLAAVAVQSEGSPLDAELLDQLQKERWSYAVSEDILEDMRLDTIGLVKKNGYPIETYIVKTEDDYLLTLHHIPRGKVSDGNIDKPVVFLMHGLLSSSADWVLMGPEKGLGYILADEGFDVWMGNARGNTYSKNHMTLNPSNDKFWKFGWHEIGMYDLPAMIDFVLKKTNSKKLHYVSHSQGSTTFFVMASKRPEYNDKIKSMHAMAPIAYMSNLKSPLIRMLAPMTTTLGAITKLFGINEFLPSSEMMSIGGKLLCEDGSLFLPVCTNILFLLCGYNPEQLNVTMLPVMMSHTPAGSSSQQFIHYGQLFNSGKFREYDYGRINNLKKYGSTKPPAYSLKNIRAPVALHYSDNDWLSHPKDVDQLHKELPNSIGKFRVTLNAFNHLDYMWAIDVKNIVYNRVINLMRAFN